MATPPVIFHITTRDQWTRAVSAGEYRGDTLATEGFIHCSREDQITEVANTRFRGRNDLVLVHIDDSRLRAPLIDEATEGVEEFPHIHGPLNLDAVVKVSEAEPRDDGSFLLP